ncbi:MAG: MmgE/PrpD family protein [Betaproteobacteria bacterium]|nr:MmgE/PrpD family protein [Betaproteobacteria bacterium]
MDVTSQLGTFAAGLTYADLPPDVRERCRMSFLDAIGIMLGAADFAKRDGDRCLETYLEGMAPPGKATVLGYGIRTTPLMAAFANGTLMEALDCQDSNMKALMHSGSSVIPTALVLAETNPITWADLVPAIIAGYEVHTRLMLAVQPGHWYKGFQGTGTFGTCAAATTAGRLLGFDARQMTAALGISGFIMPVSNGDNQFKGYNVKPVHGGQAAMCGLSSAYMAQAGYRAGPLEGEPPRHHAALHILSDGPNLERTLAGLNETWHTRDVAYKPYPIGHFIVGVIELILDILAERRIKPDEVASVEVTTYKDAVTSTGKKYTTTQSNHVDAHLSIPYCVAVTLADGQMTSRQLLKDRLRDPKLHELASRVIVSEDPTMTKAYPNEWPARIVIRLHGDGSIERQIDKVKWSPHRTPTWAELSEKFHLMADPIIGPDRATRAIENVAKLKEGSTLASLIMTLTKK